LADLTTSINTLRSLLLSIKPTGADGFEALIADALATTTGLIFRLAKSGSQFGRDATTPPSAFAVAMEAKRYDENLSLNDLAGKVGIAAHVLEGKIDLWVLAATSAVGDDIQGKLHDMLANSGISLLTLDWTPHPLPPLAVLLASARDKAEAWFATYHPIPAAIDLRAIFDAIIADPDFQVQHDQLIQSMRASNVGLDALRIHSATWLHTRFANPAKSQLAFGQYITVTDPAATVIERDEALKALSDAATTTLATPAKPSLIVVLGDEGCGKTWVIARWLAQMTQPPIILFVAGRRSEMLDPAKPVRSLANLLAEQDGKSSEAAIAAWERRLARWGASGSEGAIRFVIVLDGLNEHAGKPWADILKSMLPTVTDLGGCVIASCRPAYWEREISVRLGGFPIQMLTVGNFSEPELAIILHENGIDPATLSLKLREFIRNPRVCSVALKLLPKLDQPGALTMERLLLEYWRARLEERGNLIVHTPNEFDKLLRNHAKEWVANPETAFDRDEWTQRSPAASGNHGKNFANDLTDIEEGRFMQVSEDNDGSYEFKQETLPFAIGLLITHELKTCKKAADPRELLQRILEPIRGFDVMSDAITAATGLACLDNGYLQAARVALVEASLSIQNLSDDLLDALTPYVPECPDAFFDVAELVQSNVREDDLLELLLRTRDHERVRDVVRVRILKWLGCWTRQLITPISDERQARQQTEHEAHIDEALDKMSGRESNFFETHCFEAPQDAMMRLSHIAVLLMAGRPQRPLVTGLLAIKLVSAVAPFTPKVYDNLAWAVRLNPQDYLHTEKALIQHVDAMMHDASEPFRHAAAFVLRMLGTSQSVERANGLYPTVLEQGRRQIEELCDTDPYDPWASIGSNLDNARIAAAKIVGPQVWIFMGNTVENSTLEKVTPALARFDAPVIIRALHEVINSIENRIKTPLRQLSWRLPELSPLFDSTAIDAVMATYERLINAPDILESSDLSTIANNILSSLLPHFDAEAQLSILLKLPHSAGESLDLWRVLKVLPAERLEHHLNEALKRPATPDLKRVLFFAAGKSAKLTDCAREIVAKQINNKDTIVAGYAAQVAYVAQDDTLYRMMIEQAKPYDRLEEAINVTSWRQHAIAEAVIRQKRPDLLHLVSPQLMGYVTIALGSQAYQAVKMAIEHRFNRLLQPINIFEPSNANMFLGVSHDGTEVTQWMEPASQQDSYPDVEVQTPDDLNESLHEINQLQKDFEIFEAQSSINLDLLEDDATELISNLCWYDAVLMSQHDAAQISRWLDKILAIKDQRTLRNIYNFGIVLAGAYATYDAMKAIQLLEHLHGANSIVTIVIGQERIPLYLQTLFKTASTATFVAALDPLRERFFREAFTDADLETGVISADACGASAWLDAYMNRLLASSHPGEQARGLTIAGLRHKNAIAQSALAQSWGDGFLGEVAAHARKTYQKNEWASHWFALAAATDDPIDFWRYGQLAQGIADRRFSRWLDGVPESLLSLRFGAELVTRLKTAAEKRSGKRKETLFGLKAPDQHIRIALLN
jgi:hypothetical protein